MINLAGNQDCDKQIKEELNQAGIPIIGLLGRMNSEVPARVIGVFNGFTFQRAWYYWVVEGYMPLEYAKQLYDNYHHLDIRVAGNCGNVKPEEWSECKGYKKLCEYHVNRYLNKEINMDELEKIGEKIRLDGDQFVTSYHIDTQEGLNIFAKMVQKII